MDAGSLEWGTGWNATIGRLKRSPLSKPHYDRGVFFLAHGIACATYADAVRAGKAFGAKAGQYNYIGKTSFSLAGMQKNGGIPPWPTFDRIVRTSKPPPDHSVWTGKYYTSFVDEVKPLGLVVCTHDALELDRIVDIMERHAIDERNRNPGFLHQGWGGEGRRHHEAAKVSSHALHLRGTLQAAGLSRETHGSVRSQQAEVESERAEPCTSTHGGYRSELERGGCFSGLFWHGGPFLDHGA